MLQNAQPEMQFWGAAIKVANYFKLPSPTTKFIDVTPEEAQSGNGDKRDGASSQAHNGTQEIPDPEGGKRVVPEVDSVSTGRERV
ncbi:hypothetical protein AXG93_4846s1020 [Marchantia polymorpha subsp. ruderalis]|uniref:Uncharacterized protein n=1 Tax=Marchantia polymorpha subsp. ruderalis TaxID=1480154 RepID=A0A176VE91_MARPO|nr:hypothetical protein AXG93_4846s1020 [Marchantia polymorpha subsp. ruderalis]